MGPAWVSLKQINSAEVVKMDIEDEHDALWREGRGLLASYEERLRLERQGQRRRAKLKHDQDRADRWRERLTDAELAKNQAFGEKAIARTPEEAKLLAYLNGHVALEREERALSQFKIDDRLRQWLDENLGFKPGADTMSAAHKGLRATAAFLMAKRLRKFRRKKQHKFNFFFVTIIHDGWRSTDRDTRLDLKDIRTRVRNVFHRHKRKHGYQLDHIGVIEIDAVVNYPGDGHGCCIMPHVHMIVWTAEDVSPTVLQKQLVATKSLVSEWGAPTVVCTRLAEGDVAHKAYYLFEQPYKAKWLAINPQTGEKKLRTAQSWVPPHLTLRLSEILAHCTLKELIISGGKGIKFKGSLVKALRSHQRQAGLGKKPVQMNAARAFHRLRQTTTKGEPRSPISVRR